MPHEPVQARQRKLVKKIVLKTAAGVEYAGHQVVEEDLEKTALDVPSESGSAGAQQEEGQEEVVGGEGQLKVPEDEEGTACEMCATAGAADKMLLCDGCDRGWHIFCLKPPLPAVPDGRWLCPICINASLEECQDTRPPTHAAGVPFQGRARVQGATKAGGHKRRRLSHGPHITNQTSEASGDKWRRVAASGAAPSGQMPRSHTSTGGDGGGGGCGKQVVGWEDREAGDADKASRAKRLLGCRQQATPFSASNWVGAEGGNSSGGGGGREGKTVGSWPLHPSELRKGFNDTWNRYI